jgi:hypothetical protein
MALKILNENFFDDIKDSDIEKDSESQLQPNKNSKKSY